jgi:hypothetical protein
MKPTGKGGKLPGLDPTKWYMKLKGIPCFLIGNAPSLLDVDLSPLENYFTIGLNRIFFKLDTTILMWQDLALWIQEKNRIVKTKSIKYCRSGSDTIGGFYNFKLISRDPKITHNLNALHGRGSSGSLAYQLAWALGCDPIFLVGMDCKNGSGGITDFYGKNPMHKPHTLPNCVKGLKFISRNRHGRTIFSCSNDDVFKENKITLEEAVAMVKDKTYTREELVDLLLRQ